MHDLQRRRCQLSKIALEQTFERICISHSLTFTAGLSGPPKQTDKTVQTSFSESTSDESASAAEWESTSDGGSSSPSPQSGSSSGEFGAVRLLGARGEKALSTDSFPKPDL
jgi:hypothetical protein